MDIDSFGLSEDQAEGRTVYVLLKRKRFSSLGTREFVLVFTNQRTADKMRDQLNNGQERYIYEVLKTTTVI